MQKVLIVASVASMIDLFNMPNIEILRETGCDVHVAANFQQGSIYSTEGIERFIKRLDTLNIPYFHIDFPRNPLNVVKLIKASFQLKSLLSKHHYSFIHSQTPTGGFCGRLVAYITKTKVIYAAHGFHFFKGAPAKNWALFYPIEYFLAKFTDILIVTNQEDYEMARKFKAKKVIYVPGVGVDTAFFSDLPRERTINRQKLCLKDDEIALLSIGELTKRKNHEVVIRALSCLKNDKVRYFICGLGLLDGYLKTLVSELNLENRVIFLGYRRDLPELFSAADIFIFPSLQEGLPVALMQAMAAGLPVNCSKIRGHTDLIEDKKGGYLVLPDKSSFLSGLNQLLANREKWYEMGTINRKVIRDFDKSHVQSIMQEIYVSLLNSE